MYYTHSQTNRNTYKNFDHEGVNENSCWKYSEEKNYSSEICSSQLWLRGSSFTWFQYRSSYMIYFIYIIIKKIIIIKVLLPAYAVTRFTKDNL